MEQYNVTGMSCAACSARVEKAVSKVPGVTACSVSLLTNSMVLHQRMRSSRPLKMRGTAHRKKAWNPRHSRVRRQRRMHSRIRKRRC